MALVPEIVLTGPNPDVKLNAPVIIQVYTIDTDASGIMVTVTDKTDPKNRKPVDNCAKYEQSDVARNQGTITVDHNKLEDDHLYEVYATKTLTIEVEGKKESVAISKTIDIDTRPHD